MSGPPRVASRVHTILAFGFHVVVGCTTPRDESGTVAAADATSVVSASSVSMDGSSTSSLASDTSMTNGVRDIAEASWGTSQEGTETESAPTTSATGETTDEAPANSEATRRVFATSQVYSGNLGGVDGGDRRCAERAAAASLGGTWRAWLSTTSQSAADRLQLDSERLERIDGERIAVDAEDLLDGELAVPILLNENGAVVSYEVWTGTRADGSLATSNCSDWTSDAESGRCGAPRRSDGAWTDNVTPLCTTRLGLYCIEDR